MTIPSRLALLLTLAALAAAAPTAAQTAPPPTLSGEGETVSWTGEAEGTRLSPAGCSAGGCHEFHLTLALPDGAWRSEGGVQIGIRWVDEAQDLGLYVYGPDGAELGSSAHVVSTAESVHLARPANGRYRVLVVPFHADEPVPFEGFAQVERPVHVMPVRDLLPDLVSLAPRHLQFATGGYYVEDGLGDAVSCYPEETLEHGATRCLRFDQIIANVGDGPFELRFVLGEIAGTRPIMQRIHRSDGEVSERRAASYEYHPTHAHFHYEQFAQSHLWAMGANGRRAGDEPVRSSQKNGFCMIDVENVWFGQRGDAARTYHFPQCNAPEPGSRLDMINGISRGWADVYNWFLPGQYMELSGVPDGTYLFESVADPGGTVVETDESNNCVAVPVRLAGDEASIVGKPQACA
jgi:hypothetical protein